MEAAPTWHSLEQAFAIAGMHRLLDARLVRSEAGVAVEAQLDERFASIPGRLHGGVVACLLDTAATWALVVATSRLFTTVDLRTDFLRPAGLGKVRSVGEVLAVGSHVARARAALFDASGTLCAVATGTFAPVGPPPARGAPEP
jgi:uncharacterized protein (TIGR00369 family)